MDNATPRPWKVDNEFYIRDSQSNAIGQLYGSIGSFQVLGNASLIVRAVNSHDELMQALKRLMLTEGTGSHNETLCYCDDYRKPEICQFCQATQAIAKASIK